MKTIAAIGQIGPPAKAALPVLSNMAQSDAPGEIREAARAAIQKISPEKVPPEDK
jgi:hypothetical protein